MRPARLTHVTRRCHVGTETDPCLREPLVQLVSPGSRGRVDKREQLQHGAKAVRDRLADLTRPARADTFLRLHRAAWLSVAEALIGHLRSPTAK